MAKCFVAVCVPLIAFYNYWRQFDGTYSEMDLLWAGVVSIFLGMAIFMYFPVAKKIENFSMAWFFMLNIFVFLMFCGVIFSAFDMPIIDRAWGYYILYFATSIPVIHYLFRYTGKHRQKDSFFKRIRIDEQEKRESTV